jgi:hypothetical protein
MAINSCIEMVTLLPLGIRDQEVKSKKKPEKLKNLLHEIRDCIEKGEFTFTKHALERQNERIITTVAVLYVLKTGHEEKEKTRFDSEKNRWKYAIRGKTSKEEDIRVIISFDENKMLIITVMHVEAL